MLDRGKVMSYDELEAGKEFGRYLDVDGDGIPYRTYPGTHPKRGSYFTRGTTKDRYARYTEDGATYVDNMQRLLRKFETAKQLRAQAGPPQRVAADPRRRDLLRLDRGRDRRVAGRAAASRASTSIRCASAPFRSTTRSSISSPSTTRSSSSSRIATRRCACCWSTSAPIDAVAPDLDAALRRHADHRALHHPRDRREARDVQRDSPAQGSAVSDYCESK